MGMEPKNTSDGQREGSHASRIVRRSVGAAPSVGNIDTNLPIFTASVDDINHVFDTFNKAYEALFKRYAATKNMSIYDTSEGLVEFLRTKKERFNDDERIHPDYMRHFLGDGIVHSYKKTDELEQERLKRKSKTAAAEEPALDAPGPTKCPMGFTSESKKPPKEASAGIAATGCPVEHDANKPVSHREHTEASTRVGQALSIMHMAMRNAAKRIVFDVKALEARDPELAEALNWLASLDSMKGPSVPVARPTFLEGMTNDQVNLEVNRRFSALKTFPVKGVVDGVTKSFEIPNRSIEYKYTEYYDADIVEKQHDTSLAAVTWGARHAGISIKGRPEGSPMKTFLEYSFSLANEAGRKMMLMHQYIGEAQPELAPDYRREPVARTLIENRKWLKVAHSVDRIMGTNGKGFADALKLINSSSDKINFESSIKAAVLLYTVTERLSEIKAKHEPLSVDREVRGEIQKADPLSQSIMQGLNQTSPQGMGLEDTIKTVREMSQKMADIGERTEAEIRVVRNQVRGPVKADQFKSLKMQVLEHQAEPLKQLFQQNPKYLDAIKSLDHFVEAVREPAKVDPHAHKCIEYIFRFCEGHEKGNWVYQVERAAREKRQRRADDVPPH